MSGSEKPPFFISDDEDEFLVPPGQPGSLVDHLAPPEAEHVFILPHGTTRVVLVGPVDDVVVVRRVKL